MDPVTAAVRAALAPAVSTLYVGFSGGRDSTVLLHALAGLRRHGVVAVHVNHGLHADADGWENHCAQIAGELAVGFLARQVTLPVGGSLEARARAGRYRAFAELLTSPERCLLLAHHRDDQSETVLLRLLQGRGVYGMPRQRSHGAGQLVRPLLDLAPDVLEGYARRHSLRWLDDPANHDESHDRNFLRHRVLPALRQRWPDVDGALIAAMEAHRLSERRLQSPLGELAAAESLAVAQLEQRRPEERVELLRLWLQAHGLAAPGRRALRELLRQAATAGTDRQPLLQVPGASVRVQHNRLHLIRPEPVLEKRYPLALPATLRLPHGVLEVRADPDGFQPVGPVEVRFRTGGERLSVAGHHRALKQLLQESAIPPWQRNNLPLLFDTEGLLAVPGVAHRDRNPSRAPGWQVTWRPTASPAPPSPAPRP